MYTLGYTRQIVYVRVQETEAFRSFESRAKFSKPEVKTGYCPLCDIDFVQRFPPGNIQSIVSLAAHILLLPLPPTDAIEADMGLLFFCCLLILFCSLILDFGIEGYFDSIKTADNPAVSLRFFFYIRFQEYRISSEEMYLYR